MKRIFSAVLLVLTLGFPWSVFAQADGSAPQPAAEPQPIAETRPAEAAPVTPSASAPSSAATATPTAAPEPVVAPAQDAPAPAQEPDPVPLETLQETLETVADEAPAPLQPWLAAVAGAIGGIVVLLGIQAAAHRARGRGRRKCERCGGSGREGVCETCKGARTVEEEEEKTLECPRCDAEGETDCASCEGEGGTDAMSCSACKGAGTVGCAACLGQGEAAVTVKRAAACPDCSA